MKEFKMRYNLPTITCELTHFKLAIACIKRGGDEGRTTPKMLQLTPLVYILYHFHVTKSDYEKFNANHQLMT